VCWQWSLNSSSQVFTYVGSVLNFIIVALPILFFKSDVVPTAEYVAVATFLSMQLTAGFSQFMNTSSQLSDLAGYTARIADMIETLDDLDKKKFFSPKEPNSTSDVKEEETSITGSITEGDFIQL